MKTIELLNRIIKNKRYLMALPCLMVFLSFQNCGRSYFSALPSSELKLAELNLVELNSVGTINASYGAEDKINIGHAGYMASAMTLMFVNPSSSSSAATNIKTRINTLVTAQIPSMGGPCNRYEGNCPGGDRSSAPMVTVSNAIRKGYLVRACEEILSIDEAVITALSNASLGPAAPASDASLLAITNLFFPGREISNNILIDLKAQHQAALNLGQTSTDAWRFVFVSLCTSPLLEML